MANKMATCRSCGSEVARTANRCPKCGAQQHVVALSAVAIIVVATVFFVGFSLLKDSASLQPDTQAPPGTEVKKDEFLVGEPAEIGGISVVLDSVSTNTGDEYLSPESGKVFLLCEFEVENNSKNDIALSEIFFSEFEAYIDDYATKYSLYAHLSTDVPSLGGPIAAGKKMRGVVGFDADESWSNIEIKFSPDFWNGESVTFVAENGE